MQEHGYVDFSGMLYDGDTVAKPFEQLSNQELIGLAGTIDNILAHRLGVKGEKSKILVTTTVGGGSVSEGISFTKNNPCNEGWDWYVAQNEGCNV